MTTFSHIKDASPTEDSEVTPLLDVRDVRISFAVAKHASFPVLCGVNLRVAPREIVALVGGSGSGKTLLGLACMRLLPPEAQVTGSILWEKRPLEKLPPGELLAVRGRQIAMIFQDAQASLNPVYSIQDQFRWVLAQHRNLRGGAADEEASTLLKSVQLTDSGRILRSYPHQLSGGMCQRIMIGLTLACRPKLLIADEPTSALDRLVQAEIIELLSLIHRQTGMSMLVITHDLGMARRLANRIAVIHDGRIVEEGEPDSLFLNPVDDYTKRLLSAATLCGGEFQSDANAAPSSLVSATDNAYNYSI